MSDKDRSSALAEVKVGCDIFENAIRQFGIRAACEYFGHDFNGEFADATVKLLHIDS